MVTRSASASAVIEAPAQAIYSIIADYRDGHPRILPKPPFVALNVQQGGVGEGSVIRVEMRVLGRVRTFHAVVTEPEPGRTLVETNDTGYVTTFTVDPLEDGHHARVTISSEPPATTGVLSTLQRWLAGRILRPVFVRELALLSEVAQNRARTESVPTSTGGAALLDPARDPDVLPESEWNRVTRAPWTWVEREEAARCLVRMYESAGRGRLQNEADDLLLEALATVDEPRPAPDGPPPPSLARARDALLARGPKPSTRELAAAAGMHPVHFARVFRRHLGCSPTDMARRGRLRAATEALAWDRDREIGRLPHRCGYYDYSHMCRELRRSLGITPTLLRALARPVQAVAGARR